jgi:hypothetical protein
VADLTAELCRVHVFDGAVRSQRHDQQVDDRQREHQTDDALMVRIAQIDLWDAVRREPEPLAAALEHRAQRDHHQADHEKDRQDDEENQPEVGIAMNPEKIGEEDEDEDHGADRSQQRTRNGQGMACHV